MGSGFSLIPGDLGIIGKQLHIGTFLPVDNGPGSILLERQLFLPISNAIAFSDNLLGSAVSMRFSAELVWIGNCFQAWYILGFFLNYVARFLCSEKAGV